MRRQNRVMLISRLYKKGSSEHEYEKKKLASLSGDPGWSTASVEGTVAGTPTMRILTPGRRCRACPPLATVP
jgi:hypothetical protein